MSAAVLNHQILPHRFLSPTPPPSVTLPLFQTKRRLRSLLSSLLSSQKNLLYRCQNCNLRVVSCLSSSSTPRTRFNPSTRLFVSGLSFHTTEESLRKAFKNFGELVEVPEWPGYFFEAAKSRAELRQGFKQNPR